jgi:hypothetical protein
VSLCVCTRAGAPREPEMSKGRLLSRFAGRQIFSAAQPESLCLGEGGGGGTVALAGEQPDSRLNRSKMLR